MNQNERLLKLPDVMKMTALSRAGVYYKLENESFPRPVRLGARAIAWRLSDIQRWIEDRPTVQARDSIETA